MAMNGMERKVKVRHRIAWQVKASHGIESEVK
jgi:hypothetical protein